MPTRSKRALWDGKSRDLSKALFRQDDPMFDGQDPMFDGLIEVNVESKSDFFGLTRLQTGRKVYAHGFVHTDLLLVK